MPGPRATGRAETAPVTIATTGLGEGARRAAPKRGRGLRFLTRLAPGLTLLVLVGPLVFGLVFTLLPAFGILPALGGTEPTLEPFRALAAQPGILRSSLLSFGSALATTAISLAIVAAFLAATAGTEALARVQGFVSPLLAVPHAAVAFGIAFLIVPSGLVSRFLSPWATGWERPPDALIVNDPLGLAMIAGLILKEVPFLLLVALAALPQLRIAQTRRLTASLGHAAFSSFFVAIWPLLYRQVRLAVFAVIAYASAVVDVAVILGPQLPPTLAVRLLDWMQDPDLSSRFLASAGAILQLGVTLAALGTWWIGERIGGAILRAYGHAGERGRTLRPVRAVLGGVPIAAMVAIAVATFAGLAALLMWSLAGPWRFPDALPSAFTLSGWMRALPRALDPLWVTVLCALLATGIATLLTLGCLERERAVTGGMASRTSVLAQRALPLLYLPLLVPQIAFLFGFQVLLVTLDAVGTIAALVLAHLVFVLPYVFLSLSDPWRAMDHRFDLAAASLGASRARVLWRVRLPMLARAIGVAAAVGFAVSVGQYLPTVLAGGGRLPTITTEAVQLASGGNRRTVAIYAFLQTILPFLAFLLAALVPAILYRGRRGLRV